MSRKFVFAPNPFKGTMYPEEVCDILERCFKQIIPDCVCEKIPMADGGEGTTKAVVSALGGVMKSTVVRGPFGKMQKSSYGILPGKIGIVEAAKACGLASAFPRLDPEAASSYGLGELIQACIDEGCKKIFVGLGGSCTNDCGCGLLSCLGAVFKDSDGREFVPCGGTLNEVAHVSLARLRKRLDGLQIIGMCDVVAPLYGPGGASLLYSEQKGAGPSTRERLEKNVRSYAHVMSVELNIPEDRWLYPGTGAAGGLGSAVSCVIGGRLTSGAEAVIELSHFDERAEGAECVVTGEGRIDEQTLQGKGTMVVCSHCRRLKVPCVVLAGAVGHGFEPLYSNGLTAVFTTNRSGLPKPEAKLQAQADLYATGLDLARLLKGRV